jgi:hypothetical protein
MVIQFKSGINLPIDYDVAVALSKAIESGKQIVILNDGDNAIPSYIINISEIEYVTHNHKLPI